ncbi:MAG: SDR family NAD(P)-dependent oxidoreductase [Candidatus Taylorbacteria bacterium]
MKTVLITGVGRGIGCALAEKFLADGFAVIGTSMTGKVDFKHKNLTVHQLDLTLPETIDRCCSDITRACQASGRGIDILINNSGVMFDEDETEVVIDKLRKTLEVNLIGAIDFTEHILPVMNKLGHIVNVSSSAGSLYDTESIKRSRFPYHYPAYKISKCALNMYTRSLALRLTHEDTGIIVSAVNPGWVKTAIGGDEADLTPEQAAENIYKLAISVPETGQFWFNGEKYPW